jgi:hypothetical protein
MPLPHNSYTNYHLVLIFAVDGKGKVAPVARWYATKGCVGHGYKAPYILDLDTRLR